MASTGAVLARPHREHAVKRLRPLLLVLAAVAMASHAAPDPAEGKKLVADRKCETCHHNKTYGDAKAVYLRKDRRVTTWEKLKAQVALCNSELNLQLFPDEEEHIAAYLNETYYKFPAR